nr:type II toxin-antitoxin system RelB/DinJ family antitoxin [uncultured Leptotrichia sp.]
MSATTINIDEETKKEAQELFKDLGMNLTTAINIFLKQAIREQGIPFEIGKPRFENETGE